MSVDQSTKEQSKFSVRSSSSVTQKTADSADLSAMASFMRRASFKHFEPIIKDEATMRKSLWAVRFAVFADAMSTTILYPNYAFLVSPGTTEDSFESTGPFDFGAATYFLAMMALLSAAFTSCFMGMLSDRFGRRPCMLICVGISVLWTLAKYMVRDSFWSFSALNFVNGLFAGTLSVSMTYASDVSVDRRTRDSEMSYMVGIYMVGWRFGGITTILMSNLGLFTPLFAGAAMNFLATVVLMFFMIESRDLLLDDGVDCEDEGCDKELQTPVPEKFQKALFANVTIASIFDAIGDNGCFPLTMAPLAFQTFLSDFVERGEDPVMSPSVYRWCSVSIGIMAIVASFLARPLFRRVGIPIGCIAGNVIVALVPIACLFISRLEPSTMTLSVFVIVIYVGYPFVITNKMSIGLMLDRLAPVEHRGFAQGVSNATFNFSQAIAPFLFGALSDTKGVSTMLWMVSAVALFGAIIKVPLLYSKSLTREPMILAGKAEEPGSTSNDSMVDAELGTENVNQWIIRELHHDTIQNETWNLVMLHLKAILPRQNK